MLLVKDDEGVLRGQYNLTMLGVEDINTYDELKKLFPHDGEAFIPYNQGQTHKHK